jgi:hypothetical protein
MSLQAATRKLGGYVRRAMNGRLISLIGTMALVVHTAQGKPPVMIIVWQLLIPISLSSGTPLKTAIWRQMMSHYIAPRRRGGYVTKAMNGRQVFIIGAMALVAHFAQETLYATITAWQPETLN